ncbi:MAG: hypothetical protein H8D70_02800 [Rhodospirillaceae bacterium]|nr:hypothetical protein [Rhodospirillaceae bacterium]
MMNKMQITIAVAIALMLAFTIILGYLAEDRRERAVNLSLLFAAAGLGWVGGALLSPYQSEISRFAAYGAALSTFVTGYLIGKIDGSITRVLSPENLLTGSGGVRVLSFVTVFVVSGWLTYAARSYP